MGEQRRDSLCDSAEDLVIEDVSSKDLAYLEAFATPRSLATLKESSPIRASMANMDPCNPRVSPHRSDNLKSTREVRPNAMGSPEFQARLVAAAEEVVEKSL